MFTKLKFFFNKFLKRRISPRQVFLSPSYIRHNQRRQEHLASLNLPIYGKTVLELGAGIGNHTSFFLDRNCAILSSDGRSEHVKIIAHTYPNIETAVIDLDNLSENKLDRSFDIVYSYGVLYHLKDAVGALRFMSERCKDMLLLETCVSFFEDEKFETALENSRSPSQSIIGVGCRPSRNWIFKQLKSLFEYVYVPVTQPNHNEFPVDWTCKENHKSSNSRCVFIASRGKIVNSLLSEELLMCQERGY